MNSTDKYTIRPMTLADAPAVSALLFNSIQEYPHAYPTFSGSPAEIIQEAVVSFSKQPTFFSTVVETDRPVAFILARGEMRAFQRYAFVWAFYVEPAERGNDVTWTMFRDFFTRCKAAGIDSWESNSDPATSEFIQKFTKRQAKVKYHRISHSF